MTLSSGLLVHQWNVWNCQTSSILWNLKLCALNYSILMGQRNTASSMDWTQLSLQYLNEIDEDVFVVYLVICCSLICDVCVDSHIHVILIHCHCQMYIRSLHCFVNRHIYIFLASSLHARLKLLRVGCFISSHL
jgi:hypothetical protein